MLTVSGAGVRFGATRALHEVSLELDEGQVLAVLGPSGCGKSTLLRAVAGLERLETGSVAMAGRDLAGVPTHRRGVALMFQDGQLFPHLSVGRNVAYPLRVQGEARGREEGVVTELLELVGLAGYAGRAPRTLSGGEQQRVALARALAARPQVLLLDEPLSALDRTLRERLALDLRAVLTRTGTTALLVTHDHDEAFTVADRVAVMFAGRVVQEGPTLEVWRAPASEDVARFVGYRSVLDGQPARVVAQAAGLDPVDGTRVALRRSGVWVDSQGPLRATVTEAVATADAQHVRLDVTGVGALDGLANQSRPLAPGEVVSVVIDRHNLAVL